MSSVTRDEKKKQKTFGPQTPQQKPLHHLSKQTSKCCVRRMSFRGEPLSPFRRKPSSQSTLCSILRHHYPPTPTRLASYENWKPTCGASYTTYTIDPLKPSRSKSSHQLSSSASYHEPEIHLRSVVWWWIAAAESQLLLRCTAPFYKCTH